MSRFFSRPVFFVTALLAGLSFAASVPVTSSIVSNFNGTSIPGNDFVWFNSVINPSFSSGPVTYFMTNSHISFGSFDVSTANAEVTFSPSATTPTTTFDAGTNTWITVAPTSFAGNAFLNGLAFQVPSGGISGGLNPVTWTADFSTDTAGSSLQWQWGAAVYTSFSVDNNLLGVKPIDSNSSLFPSGSIFANADHAGTPENFKNDVIGGARGGGGSNFTGSYSATGSVTTPLAPPPVVPLPAALWMALTTLAALGAVGLIRRRMVGLIL